MHLWPLVLILKQNHSVTCSDCFLLHISCNVDSLNEDFFFLFIFGSGVWRILVFQCSADLIDDVVDDIGCFLLHHSIMISGCKA